MRKTFLVLIALANSHSVVGQSKESNCVIPPNNYVDSTPVKVFDLSNGNRIGLAGYVEQNTNEELYSEFVLAVCGAKNVIDFWGATTTCRIRMDKDKNTLFVEELKNLPTGAHFTYSSTVWTVDEIATKNGELQRRTRINPKFPLYGSNEKAQVLIDYAKAKNVLNEQTMQLADKLFVATISGDKTARKYFIDFENKYGPLDGEYAEWYNDLAAMLRNWDEQTNGKF